MTSHFHRYPRRSYGGRVSQTGLPKAMRLPMRKAQGEPVIHPSGNKALDGICEAVADDPILKGD